MSVTSADFIALADRLLISENTEIGWRAVAGRAYYGAFHCCAGAVKSHPSAVIDYSLPTHERIFRAANSLPFSATGAADFKRLAYLTMNLRAIRNGADYDIDAAFLRDHAVQAIAAAKNIENLRAQFRNKHGI
jgi:uncharacterized protein (UPF0332 family)